MQMKFEDRVMEMYDVTENIKVTNDRYFPTVEEMVEHNVEKNIQKYLPMLVFFSEDPFRRDGIELEEEEQEKYDAMVSYVKKIMYKLF